MARLVWPSRQARPCVSEMTTPRRGCRHELGHPAQYLPRGAVRVLGKQGDEVLARHVRRIYPRVGAHETVPRLADDDAAVAVHPHDGPALSQHDLYESWVSVRRRRELEGQRRRLYFAEVHGPALRLRDHLLRHDENVPVADGGALRPRRGNYDVGENVSGDNLADAGYADHLEPRYRPSARHDTPLQRLEEGQVGAVILHCGDLVTAQADTDVACGVVERDLFGREVELEDDRPVDRRVS